MRSALTLMLFGALLSPAAAQESRDVYGDWYTPEKDSIIRLADCGDGTPCGTVIWIDKTRAKVLVDENNPDPALRERPMEGVTLLSGFAERGEDWRGGTIYNPEDGKSYDARLKRMSEEELQVKGCVGPFCKGMVWTAAGEPRGDAEEG